MGCLNSIGQFKHWFGNIHLSGPCNRACYFCIGQHMMKLDHLNNLHSWPMPGMDDFVQSCIHQNVKEVNLTGSNTDPLLFDHILDLSCFLRSKISGVKLGIRSNGILAIQKKEQWRIFDKASISITSLNPELYLETMCLGEPPNVQGILEISGGMDIKANVVLCPETIKEDVFHTIDKLQKMGIKRINLREPYGQPHLGDPLRADGQRPTGQTLGMPMYDWNGCRVVYWNVHFVEVESVNLYANGRVSMTYPITKGYVPDGEVYAQNHWEKSGRQQQQWIF